MIPLQTSYMLGFTVTFLSATLFVALFVLYRIHRRLSAPPRPSAAPPTP